MLRPSSCSRTQDDCEGNVSVLGRRYGGKVAVVTGASSGIGRRLALELGRQDLSTPGSSPTSVSAPPAELTVETGETSTSLQAPPAHPAVSAPTLLQPGSYAYTTDGGERADALGGSTHEYPSRTAITIRADGCGVTARWDALEEREEWALCVQQSRIGQPTFTSHQEFFGQSNDETFTCDEGAYLLPPDPRSMEAWRYGCRSDDVNLDMQLTPLGTTDAEAGGEHFTVCRVQLQVTFSGATTGQLQEEDWYACDTGLLVFRDSSTSSDSPSPVGQVHYEESYTLRLESLEPLT